VAQRRPGQASPQGIYGELLPRHRLTHRSPPGKDADLARLTGQRLDQARHPGLDHHEGQAVVEGGPHRLGLPAPARPGCPDPGDWDGIRDVVRAEAGKRASRSWAKAEREGGSCWSLGQVLHIMAYRLSYLAAAALRADSLGRGTPLPRPLPQRPAIQRA
jgi:hypothetical protein